LVLRVISDLIDYRLFQGWKKPITKRKLIEIFFSAVCLVMEAFVVTFGDKTFADGAAEDEVLIYN